MSVPDEETAPPWLAVDEQATWYALGHLLARLPAALERQMQRDAGISQFDYMILSALSSMPGRRLRLSELARLTGSTLSRLSNAVTRLEKRDWVLRETDPEDGRFTYGILTDAGLAKVEESAPAHVAEVRRLVVDPLSKGQQNALREAARRIIAAIDPEAIDPEAIAPDAGGVARPGRTGH